MMNVCIIQARTGSSRLPGKILMKVNGKTMLEHMVERISNSKKIDKIVIATTTKKNDDIIVSLAEKLKVDSFRGSEDDVLDRYYNAGKKFNANTIIRLCSDSPILNGTIVDRVIESYFQGKYDYVSNLFPIESRTYPDGLGVEVFSSEILKDAYNNAKKPSEREHVTFYMWMNDKKFNIHRVDYKKNLSHFRFNLDYQEDFEFLKIVFENMLEKNECFTLEETIEWLNNNPDIFKINNHIKPNQGWEKSFQRDKEVKTSLDE